MFAAIKSEFRKLITVRSTYVVIGIALLLILLFAFYASGLKASPASLLNTNLLASQAQQAILATGGLGALVGVLLVTHEYRYNTIMYTLTSSNSRTRTFLAKFLVVSGFALAFALFVGVLAPMVTLLGIRIKEFPMISQHFDFASLLWHVLFVGWGYSILGFIFAMIIRLQVGAISAMFLIPGVVEPLIGLMLKKGAIYLPYNTLQAVVSQASQELAHISPGKAAAIFTAYAAVGLIISWQLFLRRDAS